jgi:hypothetical protein
MKISKFDKRFVNNFFAKVLMHTFIFNLNFNEKYNLYRKKTILPSKNIFN